MDNAQSEKGKTSVFCLIQLHSALVGPNSQPQGSNSVCYFRDSGMQYISPPASMRRGSEPDPGRQVAGRSSCAPAGQEACGLLNPKHWQILNLGPVGFATRSWAQGLAGWVWGLQRPGFDSQLWSTLLGATSCPAFLHNQARRQRQALSLSDQGNCLEHILNLSPDMAGMVVEHAKWPVHLFSNPKRMYTI